MASYFKVKNLSICYSLTSEHISWPEANSTIHFSFNPYVLRYRNKKKMEGVLIALIFGLMTENVWQITAPVCHIHDVVGGGNPKSF